MVLAATPLAILDATYGSFLPQSVAAKGQMRGSGLFEVLRMFFFPGGSVIQSVLTLLAPLGLVLAWSRLRFVRALALWTGVYVLAYALARPPMWTWYGLPVYFAKAVLAGLAIAWLTRHLPPRALREWPRDLVGGLAAAAFFAAVVTIGAGASPVRTHVYEPLRAWCSAHTTGRETIAAGDVGAVGYYCNAFIYDLAGLTWPERMQFKNHLEVITALKPTHIFAEASDYWRDLYDPGSDLRRVYHPVIRFSRNGQRNPDIPPAQLTRGWQQDYVLFERRERDQRAQP
jgi:hypothetical protein